VPRLALSNLKYQAAVAAVTLAALNVGRSARSTGICRRPRRRAAAVVGADGGRFPLDRVGDAYAALAAGVGGKVLVLP